MLARPKPQFLSVAIRDTSPAQRVGIWYIGNRLGRDRASEDGTVPAASERWLIGRIRQFITKAGFPPPIPGIRADELLTGADAVNRMAMWEKAPVDAWFEGLLPPAVALAVDNDRTTAWADELDARAAAIAQGQAAHLTGRRA